MTRESYIQTLREFVAEVRSGALDGCFDGEPHTILRLTATEAEELAEMLEEKE
jgi:hypothetical protein